MCVKDKMSLLYLLIESAGVKLQWLYHFIDSLRNTVTHMQPLLGIAASMPHKSFQ